MVVSMSMYKKLKSNSRMITGNMKADKVYENLFLRKSVKNKRELKEVFWKELKQSFIHNERPIKNLIYR
ncbi:hypothetical protein [Crassaminicella indica]|uniref:Uncharacterized protein n=1 Tax=Crassaminicella indica TaxID=2855394 RepID=A0ABX8RCS3_9CLOT|nr:hypothetical protein [Crassaminicella indica]QXM06855.1 hypothetical protein KVH43_03790 [Crassaminicella indica]